MGGTKDSTKKASDKVVEKTGFTFGYTHEDLPDALQLLSLLFGTMAIIVKYRFCAWLALINALVCLANMRTAEIDIKSIMSSLGIAVMSIVFAYIGPTAGQFM
jgi:hypothetical protein